MQLRDSACALGDKSEREPDLSAVRPTSGRLYGISVPKPSGVPGGRNAANAAGGHHRDPGLSERGAPVSYQYSFEDLLALLHGRSPAKVDAVALNRRRVEHGHLSVGLKIHCLGDGRQFSTLVEGLGGAQKILDVNYYKHSHASLCLVLPPVGSARSAILLLECIEHFIGSALFGNPEVQIQVCSPGRLGARRSALLAIGFYLGSDTLRRYTLGDLATSFTKHQHYPRGRRLVLYDAEGDFDRNFEWWKESGKHRLVEPQLHSKAAAAICSRAAAAGWTSKTSTCLLPFSSMLSTRVTGASSACSSRRRWKHCCSGMYSAVSSMLRGSGRMIQRVTTTTGSWPLSKSLLRTLLKRVSVSRRLVASFPAGTRYQPDHLMEFCRKCSLCIRSIAVS
jgi:hypothetical protein